MRLLIVRVPEEVARKRRADLAADAKRRGQPIRERARKLAAWTLLLTDAPENLLSLQEALVLVRERWQMEMLYKLWKQYGRIDEWHTVNPWRVLCELYAKLIGIILQHWLIVLFAWQDEQRSLVKLAQVVRDTASSLLEALAGNRSLSSALQVVERSHEFRMSHEQTQETSQCCPAPRVWLDELGCRSLNSWGTRKLLRSLFFLVYEKLSNS